VPFYIKFRGLADYGLVGFYTTLMGFFMFLDIGLIATFARELVRLSPGEDTEFKINNG
jgi:hypothetical protein